MTTHLRRGEAFGSDNPCPGQKSIQNRRRHHAKVPLWRREYHRILDSDNNVIATFTHNCRIWIRWGRFRNIPTKTRIYIHSAIFNKVGNYEGLDATLMPLYPTKDKRGTHEIHTSNPGTKVSYFRLQSGRFQPKRDCTKDRRASFYGKSWDTTQ